MCLHLVGVVTIYILPRFIRGESVKAKANSVHNKASTTELTTKITSNGCNGTSIDSNGLHDRKQKIVQSNDTHNTTDDELIDETQMDNQLQCDININDKKFDVVAQTKLPMANGNGSAKLNETNRLSDEPNDDYRHDYRKSTENHLSIKIRERIDSETRNIEELIDKTVGTVTTGIVELKDDLMRVNNDELYLNAVTTTPTSQANGQNGTTIDDGLRKRNLADLTNGKETFLRKEINNAVNQKNVLPAVLSNGHGE